LQPERTGTSRCSLNWPVFWRTMAEVFAAFLFLQALFHIPIANANAILQIVPLMITAAGAVFLGEAVGWRRWTAIAVGFIGVLIVVGRGWRASMRSASTPSPRCSSSRSAT
jgi:drug/metabolite transporter (DMT)-like permease